MKYNLIEISRLLENRLLFKCHALILCYFFYYYKLSLIKKENSTNDVRTFAKTLFFLYIA